MSLQGLGGYLLTSTAIDKGLRVWGLNLRLQEKNAELENRTLRKRADGTLEFMNGSPVRAHELIPGKQYNVISTGEKK